MFGLKKIENKDEVELQDQLVKRSFKELFIIFFVFSLAGHYLEVVWAWIKFFAYGSTWYPRVVDLIPLAAPYGLGAVVLVLVIWPLLKRKRLSPTAVFGLSMLLTGTVEFLCALLLVILYGRNYFWDYSNRMFNLFGFVCLGTCILFGIASVFFLYFVYPRCEKLFEKLTKRQISKLFWTLFILYIINLGLVCIREFWK